MRREGLRGPTKLPRKHISPSYPTSVVPPPQNQKANHRSTVQRIHARSRATARLPHVPTPKIQMAPQHHKHNRLAYHRIRNAKILSPRPPSNSKDDPRVDPYQNIPWKFPNCNFRHFVPYMWNTPRNTRPYLSVRPPIAEQGLLEFAAQANTTFYQTSS